MAPRPSTPPDLRATIVRVGQPRAYLRDLYVLLLETKWRYLIAACFAVYGLVNAVFASLYVGSGDCIAGARPGSFFDAFFFSLQTLATIGYGAMSPSGTCGHVLVGIESLVGLLSFAVLTGIIFSKFARPTAGVLWSERAIIANRDGIPYLMFRVANSRGSDIVQASIHVSALLDEVTNEGHSMRRFYDLALERQVTPILLMSWLVMHRIDERSPLYGKSTEDFERGHVSITASLTGMDGTFMQTVYSYHQYQASDLARDAEFEDVIRRLPDGRFELDLGKFHTLKPATGPAGG
jgi:inward rectifier potassium channel